MSFLPYEKLTISTYLGVEEAINRLANAVDAPKSLPLTWPFGKRSDKAYEGKISGDRFKISRIINYRNSFLPIVEGKIQTDPFGSGTRIEITMRLHEVVIIFMLIWLSMVGWGAVLFTLAFLAEPKKIGLFALIPAGMFVFGCLLTIIPFKIEAAITKKFLLQLFDGSLI